MDANGLRFWMVAGEQDWGLPPAVASGVEYDRGQRRLRLLSARVLPQPGGSDGAALRATAAARLARTPATVDPFGTTAYWDPLARAVMASGALPGSLPIWSPAAGEEPTDLVMGQDGVLYIAIAGRVEMLDRRQRWEAVALTAPSFNAWRLAAHPDSGVWVLDRDHKRLARIHGLPLPARPYGPYAPATFRPCEENANPPRVDVMPKADWAGALEDTVALACSPLGQLAVLTWISPSPATPTPGARLHQFAPDGAHLSSVTLDGARSPYSLSWVSEDRVGVLLPDLDREAVVFPVTAAQDIVEPVGDMYPLRDHDGGPFLHVPVLPPAYSTQASERVPLHHLSLPVFAPQGSATPPAPIDSANTRTVWHRAYLEAVIPPHCGIKLFLAATDDLTPPANAIDWHEHRFGEIFASAADSAHTPRAAWVSTASELPHHPGLLGCTGERNRIGLFTVLIQRSNRPVSALRGRYLWVRVELSGDARSTPEIAALRAYASRFSYVEKYLPELYHEDLFGPDAERVLANGQLASRTAPDFLERFLANFEGVLTPIEDRIASAYLLTDPSSAPAEALEWLASWIGLTFDPAIPAARRRALLQAAPALYRRHGTLAGLNLALDTVTDGAVQRGTIRVVEDWRVRRTCATILGADLADEHDPLLAGLAVSGNSYVGDTLFVGDEHRQEFLALFAPDISLGAKETNSVARLFDLLANRVTVLVHNDTPSEELGLIRRIAQLETPAHVLARVSYATDAFLVGTAALVDIDTYLRPALSPRPVEVGRSQIGLRDLVLGLPALDPRLEAAGSPIPADAWQPPVAVAADVRAPLGQPFRIDAGASRASRGRRIIHYVWQLLGMS